MLQIIPLSLRKLNFIVLKKNRFSSPKKPRTLFGACDKFNFTGNIKIHKAEEA